MVRFSSLGMKLVSAMLAVASIGIAVLITATLVQLGWTKDKEVTVLETISAEKTVSRLSGEIRLMGDRLEWTFKSLDDQIAGLARQPDSIKAIESRNDVALAKIIGDPLRNIGFDGGIIIDHKLKVIGADKTGVDLLGAANALAKAAWHDKISALLAANDPSKRPSWQTLMPIDTRTASALLIQGQPPPWRSLPHIRSSMISGMSKVLFLATASFAGANPGSPNSLNKPAVQHF